MSSKSIQNSPGRPPIDGTKVHEYKESVAHLHFAHLCSEATRQWACGYLMYSRMCSSSGGSISSSHVNPYRGKSG